MNTAGGPARYWFEDLLATPLPAARVPGAPARLWLVPSEPAPAPAEGLLVPSDFDGARLTLARRLAGLRKSDLAAAVGMSATAVAGWESGAKRPSPATVQRLALSLGVDPLFFAARAPASPLPPATPHFRSLRSTSRLARDQALAYGQLAVDIATSLGRHIACPAPQVPRVPVIADARGGDGPQRAAAAVREAWAMPPGPAGHLIRLLEGHGVLVVFGPERAASVDAYSCDSWPRPVVVLNPVTRDYYRQRFDVAHELGHLVMHAGSEPGGQIAEEQANLFAAELLMPASAIRPELPAAMGPAAWHALAQLKEHWGVSIQALLYRARQLGRLPDVSYRNAMSTLTARGWRSREPGTVSVLEQPSMLPHAVDQLSAAGIDPAPLIEQCRVPADLFRVVTSRLPPPPGSPSLLAPPTPSGSPS
jgi:Zn-dependent peptidase ImmA (M78 family)/transcriptional regulator with XRE-family HTH domain